MAVLCVAYTREPSDVLLAIVLFWIDNGDNSCAVVLSYGWLCDSLVLVLVVGKGLSPVLDGSM